MGFCFFARVADRDSRGRTDTLFATAEFGRACLVWLRFRSCRLKGALGLACGESVMDVIGVGDRKARHSRLRHGGMTQRTAGACEPLEEVGKPGGKRDLDCSCGDLGKLKLTSGSGTRGCCNVVGFPVASALVAAPETIPKPGSPYSELGSLLEKFDRTVCSRPRLASLVGLPLNQGVPLLGGPVCRLCWYGATTSFEVSLAATRLKCDGHGPATSNHRLTISSTQTNQTGEQV